MLSERSEAVANQVKVSKRSEAGRTKLGVRSGANEVKLCISGGQINDGINIVNL